MKDMGYYCNEENIKNNNNGIRNIYEIKLCKYM